MAFKEAHYYQADVITAGDDKLINYRKRYKINFGALNYYKWETNTKYTFSFTIKTDTDGVVIDNLNDGYYDHSQNIQLPKIHGLEDLLLSPQRTIYLTTELL